MRTLLKVSMIPVVLSAVVLSACGKSSTRADGAISDELKRDLQMASSTSLDLASRQSAAAFPLTELPAATPSPSTTLRKSAGPKAVRSRTPTVKAAPEPTVATEVEEPEVEVTAEAPSPTLEPMPEPDAPAVPRPSPINPAPAGDGSWGRNGGGSAPGGVGGGSVLGGIFGVVIRGGGVDGDRCEIHNRRPRNRAGILNGGIYTGPRSGPSRLPGSPVGGDITRRTRAR